MKNTCKKYSFINRIRTRRFYATWFLLPQNIHTTFVRRLLLFRDGSFSLKMRNDTKYLQLSQESSRLESKKFRVQILSRNPNCSRVFFIYSIPLLIQYLLQSKSFSCVHKMICDVDKITKPFNMVSNIGRTIPFIGLIEYHS